MIRQRISITPLLMAALAAPLTACGGGGGGGSDVDVGAVEEGKAVVCAGRFYNTITGQETIFPCTEPGGACTTPSAADTVACTPQDKTVLPGFEDVVPERWCACKLDGVSEAEQEGSCQETCNDIIEKSPIFADEEGWECEAAPVPEGQKPDVCTPGSVVYLNGGPSDYGIQLVGTQRTTARFDVLGSEVTRSDTSDVDGWMTMSIEGRGDGCATGCPVEVSDLQFIIRPFRLDGYKIAGVGWDGLSVGTTTISNQGQIRGVIFDDGTFELQPGNGAELILEVTGDESLEGSTAFSRSIHGHLDFATNAVSWDRLTLDFGDHDMRIGPMSGGAIATPPSSIIATAELQECVTMEATPVTLDATQSSDLEGGELAHRWTVDGSDEGGEPVTEVSFDFGPHDVRLKTTDQTLARGYASKTIEVVDTTPPAWESPAIADFTSCDAQVDRQVLTPPEVTDGCTGVSAIEAWLVEANGEGTFVALDQAAAELPAGRGTIRWIAWDAAGNSSETLQEFRVGPAVVAEERIEIRDRAKVINASGALGAVGALGTSESKFGVRSSIAEALTVGPQFYQNYALVTERAQSGGSITLQYGADVTGQLPFQIPNIASIPWLDGLEGTSFGSSTFEVPPHQTKTLTGTSHNIVRVFSGARLIIPQDVVFIGELWLEPDSVVEFQSANPRLVVGQRWVHRGRVVASQPGSQLDIRVLGTEVLLERPLEGALLMAPNARVTVTTMASPSRLGLLVGDVVEIQPDVELFCDRSASLLSN